MNKKQRANLIMVRLSEKYSNPPIPLFHINEFTLLIAVLLSAQSTDKKVNELTPNLFKNGKTAKDLYNFGEQNIYNCIKQLGLAKTKSKNIYNLSKMIMEKHKNKIPKDINSLEALPGVGHKTASVVMAQAFEVATFPVDTHIHRLAQRWELTSGKNVKETEKDLKRIFPENKWNILHLQMIFYGREYCTARGCDGRVCELCKEMFPLRRKPVLCNKA